MLLISPDTAECIRLHPPITPGVLQTVYACRCRLRRAASVISGREHNAPPHDERKGKVIPLCFQVSMSPNASGCHGCLMTRGCKIVSWGRAVHLELLVGDVALCVGWGHGAHEEGPAGQYRELQPCAEAGLQLEGQHVVLVEGPAGHLAAVEGDCGAACTCKISKPLVIQNACFCHASSTAQQSCCSRQARGHSKASSCLEVELTLVESHGAQASRPQTCSACTMPCGIAIKLDKAL